MRGRWWGVRGETVRGREWGGEGWEAGGRGWGVRVGRGGTGVGAGE